MYTFPSTIRSLLICPSWTTRLIPHPLIVLLVSLASSSASAQESLRPTFQWLAPALPSHTIRDPHIFPSDTTPKTATNPSVGPAVLGSLGGSIAGGVLGSVVGAAAECGPDGIGSECGLRGAVYGFAIGSLVGSTLGATFATRRFKCAAPGNLTRAALGTFVGSLTGAAILAVHSSGVLLIPVGQMVGTGVLFQRC